MNPLATTLAVAGIARFVSWRQRRGGAQPSGSPPAEPAVRSPSAEPPRAGARTGR